MIICNLKNWYYRSVIDVSQRSKICDNGCGLLYKISWSETLTTIVSAKMINFVLKNILCKFGVSQKIITNNGTQFECAEFYKFYVWYRIEKRFAAIAHPQTNGQTKRVNKFKNSTLRSDWNKLRANGWIGCHWHYGLIGPTAGYTLFALSHGTRSMIPIEVEFPSHIQMHFDPRWTRRCYHPSTWWRKNKRLI